MQRKSFNALDIIAGAAPVVSLELSRYSGFQNYATEFFWTASYLGEFLVTS
jgi:hypothetical protein